MTGILNLSSFHELDLKELEFEYHVKAEPAAISRMCPHCGELHRVQKHGSRSMFIRDLPTHGKTMMIHLDVPRLICLSCKKTFMAVVAEVDADHAMTERLVRWMGRQSLVPENTKTWLGYSAHLLGECRKTIQAAYSDESGQRFRAKLDTHSGASWTVGA